MSLGATFPKSVKRITFVQNVAPAGAASSAVEVPVHGGGHGGHGIGAHAAQNGGYGFEARTKKKKMSRGLRSFEKWTRRFGRAMNTVAGTYVGRHDRSNRKKRDGWLRDYVFNMAKANREGMKKLHIPVFKL